MPRRHDIRCPGCPRTMRLVGRERKGDSKADLLTFQCDCGQILATITNQ